MIREEPIIKPDLLTCIIILNWNGLDETRKNLDSLFKINNNNFKVLLIDNGSKNNEAEILKRNFGEKIEVYSLKENIGFTGGVNLGISEAHKDHPDFYLLLNNDTIVDKNFLTPLVTRASTSERIGIVGSKVIDQSQKSRILYSGGEINWLLAKPFHKSDKCFITREEKFITGCSMLIKKEVIEKIGLLDDRFFAYFEDVSFCILARKVGYKCVSEPKSIVYHKQSASLDRKGELYTYLISRNRILFVNNYTNTMYKIYFFIFNLVKLLFVETYFVSTWQKKRARAYIKGYIDGLRGRDGKPRI